jgi:chromosome segregation ATPase
MRDESEIEALLDSLETLVDEAEGKRGKWKDVWGEIKSVGQAFKESMFPTAQDRQSAWNRFQSIIANVKAGQEKAKEIVEERVRESKYHLEQILSYAERATPPSGSADALLAICTGGLSVLIKVGIDAILGPFDDRKFELQKCNEAMKEGWAYLSKNKATMLGNHKQEAFDALKSASDSLTAAWDTWRRERQGAIDQFRAEKQAAWEARQAKREAWEMRIRDNISNLKDRLDRLESALDHRQSNLSKLEDMRDSAWSDSYRDRVDDWISDEHERIADIERKIDQIKGWVSDMEAKLR